MVASISGFTDIVSLLLDRGADPNIQGKVSNNPHEIPGGRVTLGSFRNEIILFSLYSAWS